MADADTTAYNIVPPSSFAYNPARINVGSIGYYTGIENVIVSSLYEVFQTADYVDDRFMWHWFKSDHFSKWIERLQEGSVRLYFYYDKLIQCEMKMPSLEEQKKMGAFFDQLDHLITLHQRKNIYFYEKVTLVWEQRKLEDIMDTVTDYVAAGSFEDIRNNVTYLNEPGYAQLVRTVDLKKKFTNNDSIYVDESAFKYLWRVNLNEECIVLPNIGANIGEVYFVEPSGLPYDNNVLGPNAILLKANEDTYFAFTALNNLTFQKQLFENVGSSGQPKFNKTELKSIQLYMPQNEEQEKIGQYFRDLDHLITLHQCKCHLLHKLLHNDWEQRKLGDVLVSLQNNTLSRADLSNEAGVAKNVHYGDVLIKFGEVLDVSKEQLPMISDESILTKYKTSFLQNGDVIIADTAEDTTVGKCSEIVGLNDEVVLSGLHTIPYRPVEKFAPKYLGYYLNSDAYHNQLLPLMQGIKVTSISKSAMQDTDIIYPKSKEEQTEIGNYFDALDHLITLHHRKYIYILKSP